MRFDFTTAHRIIFGRGRLSELKPIAENLGKRPLLVTGKDPARAEPIFAALGRRCPLFPVPHEPTTLLVTDGIEAARAAQADLIIAAGGGSALDAGKAIAALLPNPGPITDYLELVGRALPLPLPSLPCVAIPTTAGTGAEVTRNAVLSVPEARVKVSLRNSSLLPRVALIDPALTDPLPAFWTAATGMDALTQLIEPYLSSRANPFTDALCREALPPAARALPAAVENGAEHAARDTMAWASLFGGLALANAGLGAVHGLASPLGGLLDAPHGAICASLLAPVMRMNHRALGTRAPGHPALARFQEIARWLTGHASAEPEEAFEWVEGLVSRLQLPQLGRYGLSSENFAQLAGKASRSSSMQANPLPLETEELNEILHKAC